MADTRDSIDSPDLPRWMSPDDDTHEVCIQTVWDDSQRPLVEIDWERDAIPLLAGLEAARERIARTPAGDLTPQVRAGMDLLAKLTDFAATRLRAADSPASQRARGEGTRLMVAATQLCPPSRWFNLRHRPPDREQCRWILRSLPAVVERYFGIVGAAVRPGPPTDEWRAASGEFLTELRGSVARLDADPM